MVFNIEFPKSYAVKYCIIMTSKQSCHVDDWVALFETDMTYLFQQVQGVLQHRLSEMHRRELLL